MKTILAIVMAGVLFSQGAPAHKPPLLPEKDVAALLNELSGETAKRNLEGIARFHRQRGSKEFHQAAELVAERLRAYGLSDVSILEFPADGKIFYGTQRSRPAWDAESATLEELAAETAIPRKLADYEAEPVVLAEDSESADVTADLVDIGEGTKEQNYAGKEVKGKIVLVGAQPGSVQDLAVGRFGAAGMVSYAQNQKTAWWGEDENLIRWGHLDTFSPNKTFAFMVSLKTAKAFRQRLADGETISLHARVKAGQHPGNYEVATAAILGADPTRKKEEIVYSCHLDHERPGANDNASGCATILEVARTLEKLVDEKKLERPLRTIRFVFPAEIEGTMALLNAKEATANRILPPRSAGDPVSARTTTPLDFPRFIKAVIHMDMVGGGPETKAVFHVTRGPMSLPSFVQDVAWTFAEWVNEQSYQFAATGEADYPVVAPEGGKEPLRAEYSAFTMGSDHDVYQDSSFGIPAIYLNDWPDRFIHTNFDSAQNIDTTKLKRAAFIGAASGYFLARMRSEDYPELLACLKRNQYLRTNAALRRAAQLDDSESKILLREFAASERAIAKTIDAMAPVSLIGEETAPPLPPQNTSRTETLRKLEPKPSQTVETRVFKRRIEHKGPPVVFGYDYFTEHAKAAGIVKPKLLSFDGQWGAAEEYAYEVLNLADGRRNVREIRDAVSAEYGPAPVELVAEYLEALEKMGIVSEVKAN